MSAARKSGRLAPLSPLAMLAMLVLLAAPSILLVFCIPCQDASAAPAGVNVKILGPSIIGVGELVPYKLEVIGGPAATGPNGTWAFRAYVKGNNLTGVKPIESNPATGNSQRHGNFTVNVSAPIFEESLTLVVNASSKREGAEVFVERTMTIKVVKAVTINVRVYNVGHVDVKNVNVDFYVDERYVGSRNMAEIKANSSVNVSINWTVATYTPGKHVAKIVIASGNNMIWFENGSNTIYVDFYIKEEGGIGDAVWYAGIFIVALVVTWLAIMIVTKRGLKPKTET